MLLASTARTTGTVVKLVACPLCTDVGNGWVPKISLVATTSDVMLDDVASYHEVVFSGCWFEGSLKACG